MHGAELAGRRILLIAIPRTDLATAQFVCGEARYRNDELFIIDDLGNSHGPFAAEVSGFRSFRASKLPVLVVPRQLSEISRLIRDVEDCVPVFTPRKLETLPVTHHALFGLAEDAAGRPLLMQGDPDLYELIGGQENQDDGGETK